MGKVVWPPVHAAVYHYHHVTSFLAYGLISSASRAKVERTTILRFIRLDTILNSMQLEATSEPNDALDYSIKHKFLTWQQPSHTEVVPDQWTMPILRFQLTAFSTANPATVNV